MSFDLVYVNVRYSPQHNSKVGRNPLIIFDYLNQTATNMYFLKFHFLNESIYSNSIFWSFSLHAQ